MSDSISVSIPGRVDRSGAQNNRTRFGRRFLPVIGHRVFGAEDEHRVVMGGHPHRQHAASGLHRSTGGVRRSESEAQHDRNWNAEGCSAEAATVSQTVGQFIFRGSITVNFPVIQSTPSPMIPDIMKRIGAPIPGVSLAIRISTVDKTKPVFRARLPKSLVKR